jgi:hypothetical protein
MAAKFSLTRSLGEITVAEPVQKASKSAEMGARSQVLPEYAAWAPSQLPSQSDKVCPLT